MKTANSILSDDRVTRALKELGWNGRADPDEWLRVHVRDTLSGWIASASRRGVPVETLQDVLRLAAERAHVQLVELTSDDDVDRLKEEYGTRGEHALAELTHELEGDVEAGIVRLKAPAPWERPFVALVDVRGERGAAGHFGKCHEIGHPLLEPQLSFGFRCRGGPRPPLERAVDLIASEIAFFEPFARPLLGAHAKADLTYEAIDSFWRISVPFSSRTAAFSAAVRMWPVSAAIVAAELGIAKHGRDGGVAKLRVSKCVPNNRGAGIYVPDNFRVPERSVLTQAFRDPYQRTFEADEDLSWWTSSGGTVLPRLSIRVGARREGRRVIAVLRARQ